jgi:hypothetical protein
MVKVRGKASKGSDGIAAKRDIDRTNVGRRLRKWHWKLKQWKSVGFLNWHALRKVAGIHVASKRVKIQFGKRSRVLRPNFGIWDAQNQSSRDYLAEKVFSENRGIE